MMTEKQQAGKGIILAEVLAKIFGPSGFTPSTTDQVLGRFNDAIRGCASSSLTKCSSPAPARPLMRLRASPPRPKSGSRRSVCRSSNARWASTCGWRATTTTTLMSRSIFGAAPQRAPGRDAPYFAALAKEIENGGHEAFADYLLNLDVSDFVPSRDVKRDNQAKRDMICASINPFDARKWLEECCHTERLIGRREPERSDWIRWVGGAELSFAVLSAAYTEWQKTVRAPVAPKPTPVGALGEVLTKAGIPMLTRFGGHL